MSDLAREATWLARSEDRTPARPAPMMDAWAVAASLVPLGLAAAQSAPLVRCFWVVTFLLLLVVANVLSLVRRQARAQDDHAALRAEFPGEFGWLVRVIVRQGDAPTGADVGRLWSEGGRMFFAGRRTSFGLVPGQARRVGRIFERVPGVRNPVELVLRHDTAVGPMTLSFEPVVAPHKDPGAHRAALRRDLVAWMEERAEGEGQYPPSQLGPGVPDVGRLLREALLLTLPPALLVGIAFWVAMSAATPTAIFFTLALMVGAVPASSLRWRAWRARRRLG